MSSSPPSSVILTPRITRSGRTTRTPTAFGNVIDSDCLAELTGMTTDDEVEVMDGYDESPDWAGEQGAGAGTGLEDADDDEDEEMADEGGGGGDASDDDEGGRRKKSKKSSAKKGNKGSKANKAADKLGREVIATGQKKNPQNGSSKLAPAASVTKPDSFSSNHSKRAAPPSKPATKPAGTSVRTGLLKADAKSKKPVLPPKAEPALKKEASPECDAEVETAEGGEHKTEEPLDKEKRDDDCNTPSADAPTPASSGAFKGLLPALPIQSKSKTRIDLSGPAISSVGFAAKPKPKSRGIVLAKKGSLVPETAPTSSDGTATNLKKKASGQGLLKPKEEKTEDVKPSTGKKSTAKASGPAKPRANKKPPRAESDESPEPKAIAGCGQAPSELDAECHFPDNGISEADLTKPEGVRREDSPAERVKGGALRHKAAKASPAATDVNMVDHEADRQASVDTTCECEDGEWIASSSDEGNISDAKNKRVRKRSGSDTQEASVAMTGGPGCCRADESSQEQNATPEPKRRKGNESPKKSASRTTTSDSNATSSSTDEAKPAPVGKVPAAARLAMIETMTNKDYVKLVDWQSLADSFKGKSTGPSVTADKLRRHWREVLSADLREFCRASTSSAASSSKTAAKSKVGKAGGGPKEGLNKEHRKAMWHKLCEKGDKLDWAVISESADGMGTTKLKRHLRETFRKEVDKLIG